HPRGGADMKVMTRMAALVLGAIVVSGPALAEGPSSTAEVLGKLHMGNVRGYRMGKLALDRGHSADAMTFGKSLIEDRDAIDTKVVALAKQEGIVLAANTPEVGPLDLPKGPGFDAAFAHTTQAQAEQEIAQVKAARDATNDSELRSLLLSVLPI